MCIRDSHRSDHDHGSDRTAVSQRRIGINRRAGDIHRSVGIACSLEHLRSIGFTLTLPEAGPVVECQSALHTQTFRQHREILRKTHVGIQGTVDPVGISLSDQVSDGVVAQVVTTPLAGRSLDRECQGRRIVELLEDRIVSRRRAMVLLDLTRCV